MVTNARSRFWPALLLLTVIMLVHPPSARADRIDIDDPSDLGPVGYPPCDLRRQRGTERAVAEVRYLGGIHSSIYAVSGSPYLRARLMEASMVSFAVTGHPLEDTWGAIYSSDVFWSADDVYPSRSYGTRGEYLANLRWFPCCFSTWHRPFCRGLHAVASPALAPRDSHLHWSNVFLSHFFSTRMVTGCGNTTPFSATARLCRRLNRAPSASSDSGWRVWPRSCAQAAIVGLLDRVNAAERHAVTRGNPAHAIIESRRRHDALRAASPPACARRGSIDAKASSHVSRFPTRKFIHPSQR